MSGTLEGRVAIVTGAGRGIGKAIAERLAAEGASVIVADNGTGIDGNGADPTVARDVASALGAKAIPFTESIASPGAAQAAVALAVKQFGGIDIVVNNAAIVRDDVVSCADPADWEAVIRTNLSAPFYLTRAASAVMCEQAKRGRGGGNYQWGRIVNIASSVGLFGNPGQAAYTSAKAGLLGLTRVTAMDLAADGIAVNALVPFAATRLTDRTNLTSTPQTQYIERAQRIAPRHVATFVAALCAPAAAAITGQVFAVRGREIFLFGQPRPIATIVQHQADWDVAGLLAAAQREFGNQATDLTHAVDAFEGDPVV